MLHSYNLDARYSAVDLKFLVRAKNFSERLTDFQSPVVIDVALPPEPIHEQIDAGAGCAHHLGQNLVADKGNLYNRWAVLIQMSKPQQNSGETLFRGRREQIRNMIPVFVDAGKQIGHQRV